MKRGNRFTVWMSVSVVLMWYAQTCGAEDEQSKAAPPGARMLITRFEVKDNALEIGFKIRNDADHNIWICDSTYLKVNGVTY
jgi:hypothetical protein